MKIIFLDIDGVLNCLGSTSRSPSGYVGVDDDKLNRLRTIVGITGAKIVLCSTWKDSWEKDPDLCDPEGSYLNRKFKRHGLHIWDKTSDHKFDRGRGIIKYLNRIGPQNVSSWIVMDDWAFSDYEECGILPRLIHTDELLGLTDQDVKRAADLLTGIVLKEDREDE